MTWKHCVLRIMVGMLVCACAAGAQGPDAYASIDAQYFGGRPADALAAYDVVLSRDSTNFDVLWRASRAALALGILSERQDADSPMYLRAEALARAAVHQRPDRADGHYWLAAALGRRALHADLRTTVRLASETAGSANRALAIDSLHAGAEDVLGKLNSEVSKLPAVVRFIAGRLLGISVARATSWELAERHLRRAVELDSTMILYRVDLAEMYLRTGRPAEATRQLNEVLALPRLHPIDDKLQREAVAMLGTR